MKIAVIGAGNMGGSTVLGMLKSPSIKATDIVVSDPNKMVLDKFQDKIKVTTDNSEAADGADIVMVFVKPWLVEKVLMGIKPVLDYSRQMLVVVAAGVKGSQISEWMRKETDGKVQEPTFFSAIPNIAIEIRKSVTFVVPFNADARQTAKIKRLFDEMGETFIVEERLLGAGTMLASCGLAYAMRYARAASEGGVEMGFYPKDAQKIVLQTMIGAAELLQSSGEHPESAIDKVTTPGGITIKGLNAMEHAGFTSAVIKGLKAGLE